MIKSSQVPEMNWLKCLRNALYQRIIRPFIQANANPQQIAWGAAIGVFVAFTPTVGIQIYITMGIWACLRYFFKCHFSLPIAIAMVFISNPVTVVPIYYASFVLGKFFLSWLDNSMEPFNYELWRAEFSQIVGVDNQTMLQSIAQGSKALWSSFGWPLFLGGGLFAILFSVLTYPLVLWLIHRLGKAMPNTKV